MSRESVRSNGKAVVVTRQFDEREMRIVEKSETEQLRLRSFVGTSGKFSSQEKRSLQVDSPKAFADFWKETFDAQHDFEKYHEHGVGRVGRAAQNIATSGYDILWQLEPVVDLVRNLGSPYGGLAIGTIAFFFAIAKNRSVMETQIADTLEQIRDRLAGFEVYRHIYNDNHELDRQLQYKIVRAYESFIGFCIVSTKYYTMGSLKRWLKAAMSGSTAVVEGASDVQKAIVQVRYMSSELLSKNVDAIKRLSIDQKNEIEGLKSRIQELQEANAAERLRELQSLLNLGTYSRENELKLLRKYRQDVEKYFELQSLHLERMEGARLASFHESPEVRGWRTSSHSCMLVISAYNDESLYSSRECWLSPVALDVVASFEGVENPDPLAFYILMYKDSDSLPRVLSCIALQLLTLKPKGLQDQGQYAELCAELEEYREQVPSGITDSPRTGIAEETNANSHIQKVLLRILNLFDGTKTVWIVVDRADRCKGHRMKLLKAFASLVKEAKVKVRVLVVVNGYDWKVDDEIDELRQREDKSVVLKIGRQGAIGF